MSRRGHRVSKIDMLGTILSVFILSVILALAGIGAAPFLVWTWLCRWER